MLDRWFYRVRQFANGLAPRITVAERTMVADLLSPAEQRLFYSMSGYGRRHALNVCHALVAEGWSDRDLLVAALLHDVAKGRLGLPQRAIMVLLRALAPGLLTRLAISGHSGWRHPIYLEAKHACQGAEWVGRAGGSPATVALIRQHSLLSPRDERLRALQRADDGN